MSSSASSPYYYAVEDGWKKQEVIERNLVNNVEIVEQQEEFHHRRRQNCHRNDIEIGDEEVEEQQQQRTTPTKMMTLTAAHRTVQQIWVEKTEEEEEAEGIQLPGQQQQRSMEALHAAGAECRLPLSNVSACSTAFPAFQAGNVDCQCGEFHFGNEVDDGTSQWRMVPSPRLRRLGPVTKVVHIPIEQSTADDGNRWREQQSQQSNCQHWHNNWAVDNPTSDANNNNNALTIGLNFYRPALDNGQHERELLPAYNTAFSPRSDVGQQQGVFTAGTAINGVVHPPNKRASYKAAQKKNGRFSSNKVAPAGITTTTTNNNNNNPMFPETTTKAAANGNAEKGVQREEDGQRRRGLSGRQRALLLFVATLLFLLFSGILIVLILYWFKPSLA